MKAAFMIIIFALLLISLFLVFKHCKKKTKIILSSVIIIIALYCAMIYIDISRVNSLKKPIFVWQTTSNVGVTADGTTPKYANPYQGLGYKVYVESENGKIISYEMRMFGKVIAAAITNTNGENNVNSSELADVYNRVGNYFGDESADRNNLGFNSLDTKNNVVIVGLIDNSKEKQEIFLKNAKIDSKYSKYIKFEQGGPYYTSGKCNSNGLQIIIGEIKEINNPNYKTENLRGTILINIISGLDSEEYIVFYHNSNIEFKIGQKVIVGHNGNIDQSNPSQAFAECIELVQ